MTRPRMIDAQRDHTGKSREHERRQEEDYQMRLAQRSLKLIAEGVPLKNKYSQENSRDALSGTSLGKLLLRHRADSKDPSSISQAQFDWGYDWAQIVTRHAAIMGYKLHIHTPSFVMVGGGRDCGPEPDEKEIFRVRRLWSDCWRELTDVSREFRSGMKIVDVTYGACVDNWSMDRIAVYGFGNLRLGLNAVGKGLGAR